MRADENSQKTKKDYFEVKATMFGLMMSGVATITVKWIEWGATVHSFPLWPCLTWIMWGGCQTLNWFLIKSYAEIDTAWGSMMGEKEMNGMLKKDDDLRPQNNQVVYTNEIQ